MPTLIAIIIVGRIGGGLWIKKLNDIIGNTHKELSEARLQLIIEKNLAQISRLESRYNDFYYEANRFKREIDRVSDSIGQSIINLESIIFNTKDSVIRSNVLMVLKQIRNQYAKYSDLLSDLQNEYEFDLLNEKLEKIKKMQLEESLMVEIPKENNLPLNIIIPCILTLVVAVVLTIVIQIRKIKKKANYTQ